MKQPHGTPVLKRPAHGSLEIKDSAGPDGSSCAESKTHGFQTLRLSLLKADMA